MNTNKQYKIVTWLNIEIVAAFFVAMLLLGTRSDLDIAAEMFRPNNLFGKVFEAVGKIPGYLLLGVGFAILLKCTLVRKDTKKCSTIILSIVYVIGGIGAGALLSLDMVEMIAEGKIVYLGALVLGLPIFALELVSINLTKSIDWQKYRKFAFTSIFTVITIMVVCFVVKTICGRLRYEDIILGKGSFSAWYSFQRAGGSSLPSGHVALASTGFLLLPLYKENWKRTLLNAISVVFVAFVGAARMTSGAHFLSDVAIAAIISFVICMVANRISFGKENSNLEFGEKNFLAKFC